MLTDSARKHRSALLQPIGGLAGDMFIAALLDAFPEFLLETLKVAEEIGSLLGVGVELSECRQKGFAGKRFEVWVPEGMDQEHRSHSDIKRLIDQMNVPTNVRVRALEIFQLLAVAEAKVHGVDPNDVHFHEVGAWDSIIDIVISALLLEISGIKEWHCDPLPLGSGFVASAHGALPTPAPATLELIKGMVVIKDENGGERVTPTGAAVLKHLNANFGRALSPTTVSRSGLGFGHRKLADRPNALRIVTFETVQGAEAFSPWQLEDFGEITFEIDDQTPEDLALGLDRIRAHPKVRDLVQTTCIGKRGRMTSSIRVLLLPEDRDEIARLCFAETTTLGLRWTPCTRLVLPRLYIPKSSESEVPGVKLSQRPSGQTSAKAELGDLDRANLDAHGRSRIRRKSEMAALDKKSAE